MIGAEVDIAVDEADPALDVGRIFVRPGEERAVDVVAGAAEGAVSAGIPVLSKEGRIAAIFPGHVEAEPLVEFVAHTTADERRALEVVVEDLEVVELEELTRDVVDVRIGAADEAPDVPGPSASDARRLNDWRWWRKAKICGGGPCRLAQDQSKADEN